MREIATGEVVTVRAYGPEHVDALHAAVAESIPELARFETWCQPGFSRDEATDYVDYWRDQWTRQQAFYFAVEHCTTGDFLGSCGLSAINREHRHANLGFWVRSSRTGEGAATDAARVVSRLGFADLGLLRIELEIAIDNAASRRVADKLGCELEGILRRRQVLPAGVTDVAMYALLDLDGPES